jgi:hypothetical protein
MPCVDVAPDAHQHDSDVWRIDPILVVAMRPDNGASLLARADVSVRVVKVPDVLDLLVLSTGRPD